MMRPYRDVRFGKDKRPFKTNVGSQFRHFRARDVHAPGWDLHIEPGSSAVGAGIWHPEAAPLAAVRKAIDEQPKEWLKVSRSKPFASVFELSGDALSNPPRGYRKDHPLIDDLKRKDFIAIMALDERHVVTNALKTDVARSFKAAVPFMRFLCRALEIPF